MSVFVFSQKENRVKRSVILAGYGLSRNSVDFFGLGGLSFSGNKHDAIFASSHGISEKYFGSGIRISSNWYFNIENKNRWYFRTNWFMGAWTWCDGLIFPSAPLNIGIGDNIKISENLNLDLTLSGGLVLIGPGYMSDEIQPVGAIYPEIKFHTRLLSIGLIYSRYVEKFKMGKAIYNTLLIGISKGI